MKSTGLSKVDRFLNTDGHASFRLPRPFMTRKRDSGNFSGTGSLNTCGSISSTAGSYDDQVTVGTPSSDGSRSVIGIESSLTPYLSAGMIVVDGAETGPSYEDRFNDGSQNNLTRIVSVDSTTTITVDSALDSGRTSAMFAYPGNTLMQEIPGRYFPGKASIPPPASGKLYSVTAISSTYLNYSGFTPGPTHNYIFTTTGGDATVNSGHLLVAEYTTGDGLGSNVRVMWMAVYYSGTSTAKKLLIKSWETGDVVFESSSRQTSAFSPKQVQFVEIPMGGVFCEGGAVFQWGNGTSDSAPGAVYVGYQI